MSYKKINIEDWKRKEHFKVYSTSVRCGFSLTVKVEINRVISFVKEKGYKFYPTMIYLLTKAVNNHAEFRMRMKDGELVVWDEVHPIYTVLKPETETFSALYTKYTMDFREFVSDYEQNVQKYNSDLRFFPEVVPENHFNISALPWIDFDSFNLNIADFTDYFAPSFTVGKYKKVGAEVVLPLAIQVHHAVCDGIHVARFIESLQDYCDNVYSM
ncbi:type A chloramphenicol O-acetyltransferase [Sphingobacterium faecale]|uniref:Type A chloramphenicol O-acetyltransferase n=1 Tax=Sphingobacterium faecale TaxID=2803775 RepID=A0ABS1R3V5_9SPHI|nr:type A chloramphenicol O-acetyltransferase [Sphingobacterium faecale]MBL1409382.1 type A chloramphenicol O-acetyltransferase [Sphingobacterium faecale]